MESQLIKVWEVDFVGFGRSTWQKNPKLCILMRFMANISLLSEDSSDLLLKTRPTVYSGNRTTSLVAFLPEPFKKGC